MTLDNSVSTIHLLAWFGLGDGGDWFNPKIVITITHPHNLQGFRPV